MKTVFVKEFDGQKWVMLNDYLAMHEELQKELVICRQKTRKAVLAEAAHDADELALRYEGKLPIARAILKLRRIFRMKSGKIKVG